MKFQTDILNFTKTLFVSLKDNLIVGLFWNFVIVGFFLLPLGINPSTPFFIAAIALGLISIVTVKRQIDMRDLSMLSFPLLFLLMAISLLYSSNFETGIKLLERSIPLLLFPIILIFRKEDKSTLDKIFHALLAGILISFLLNVSEAFYHSVDFSRDPIFDSSVSGGYSFFESFNHGGSHFIGAGISKAVHPGYMSLYILTTLVYFWNRKRRKTKLVLFSILFLYLFLLASRGALLLLFFLLLLNVFRKGSSKSKIVKGVALLVLAAVFISINPRIQIFFDRMINFTEKENFNYTTSEQSRILIYYSCVKLIKQAPLLGYGLGTANDKLLEEYIRAKYLKNSKDKYNAHNQYFQTTLETGIFGLILLSFPFMILLLRSGNGNRIAFVLVLGGALLFESMLVRYNGIIFYAILVPLMLRNQQVLSTDPPKKEVSKENL